MAKLLFRPKHRLTHRRQFEAVHEARMKTPCGPLTIHSRRNGLPHPRLGMSIGRAFGGAVQRNRLKRCLREAFRLLQLDVPSSESGGSYDLLVTSRKHDDAGMEQYMLWLTDGIERLDREWRKREARGA
ncbi:MAG: ribonuclease P protein component [Planctomycetes bacterium]|nr:ribonuclease P protein component [Planctomycetota bacterium]